MSFYNLLVHPGSQSHSTIENNDVSCPITASRSYAGPPFTHSGLSLTDTSNIGETALVPSILSVSLATNLKLNIDGVK